MPDELTYKDQAAAGYDRAFGHITSHFAPFLLRAARIAPGQRLTTVALSVFAAQAYFPIPAAIQRFTSEKEF